ncbi:MAG: hypothetical protein FJ091_22010 [Deltaproteobacteria bacterium]|nr:hypothetical protein [Deltaproteobacteria bacterium]
MSTKFSSTYCFEPFAHDVVYALAVRVHLRSRLLGEPAFEVAKGQEHDAAKADEGK